MRQHLKGLEGVPQGIKKLSIGDLLVGMACFAICLGMSAGRFWHFYQGLTINEIPHTDFFSFWQGAIFAILIRSIVLWVTYSIIRTVGQREFVGGEWFFLAQFLIIFIYFVISLVSRFENSFESSSWKAIESNFFELAAFTIFMCALTVNVWAGRLRWAFLFFVINTGILISLVGFKELIALVWGERLFAAGALGLDFWQRSTMSRIHIAGVVLFALGIF